MDSHSDSFQRSFLLCLAHLLAFCKLISQNKEKKDILFKHVKLISFMYNSVCRSICLSCARKLAKKQSNFQKLALAIEEDGFKVNLKENSILTTYHKKNLTFYLSFLIR